MIFNFGIFFHHLFLFIIKFLRNNNLKSHKMISFLRLIWRQLSHSLKYFKIFTSILHNLKAFFILHFEFLGQLSFLYLHYESDTSQQQAPTQSFDPPSQLFCRRTRFFHFQQLSKNTTTTILFKTSP